FASRLGCGGRLRAAFAIGLFQITFERFLCPAGVVVGLLGLAVLVDRPLALAEQIKDHAEVDMAPNLGPLLGGLRNALQRFAECIGGGLVVFLVEERLTHAEIGERPPGLDVQRLLILLDRVVVAPGFGQFFSAGNRRACAQTGVSLENDVVGVDLDAA